MTLDIKISRRYSIHRVEKLFYATDKYTTNRAEAVRAACLAWLYPKSKPRNLGAALSKSCSVTLSNDHSIARIKKLRLSAEKGTSQRSAVVYIEARKWLGTW